MMDITVLCDTDGEYIGLNISGHANYAESGKDIICSAVSVLAINLANSIEKYTDDIFICEIEESGRYHFQLQNPISMEARLLVKSCVLGLESIYQEYGKKFINIIIQEVK